MHLYAVVFFPDPLKMLVSTSAALPRADAFIEFFWADDTAHALEQAVDARRDDPGIPVLSAMVPDDYVLHPPSL